MKFTGEIHPFAACWPPLPADELAALADSIAAVGQDLPIVLDIEGRLVDGRNRLAACELAGAEPMFVVDPSLTNADAVESFVDRRNGRRRNVATGQQAMFTARMLVRRGRRKDGRWAYGSISNVGNSPRSAGWIDAMKGCGLILDHAPHLADAVIKGPADGGITLNAAVEEAEAARALKRRLSAAPPDVGDDSDADNPCVDCRDLPPSAPGSLCDLCERELGEAAR